MAVDVVVRQESGCFTVVYDDGFPELEAVVIDGEALCLLSSSGKRIALGLLTPDVAREASFCRIAVVVSMVGNFVNSSKEVRLILS